MIFRGFPRLPRREIASRKRGKPRLYGTNDQGLSIGGPTFRAACLSPKLRFPKPHFFYDWPLKSANCPSVTTDNSLK